LGKRHCVLVPVENRKRYDRRAPGGSVRDARDRNVQAGQQGGLRRHHMRTQDGCVEIHFTLRNVAVRALCIVILDAAGVVRAGGKVHVVMARAAGSAQGRGHEDLGLCGSRRLRVANFATARIIIWLIRGKYHGREVEGSMGVDGWNIRRSSLYTGQTRAHVDFVEEDLRIHGVSRVRIDVLRLVAQDAHIHPAPRSAVSRQLVVAGIAAGGLDDVVNLGHFRAVGHEVVRRARIVGSQVVSGQVSRTINADGMGRGRVETGGRRGPEYVLVLARSQRRGRAVRIRTRLLRGGDDCTGGGARSVSRIVLHTIGKNRGDKTQADRAWCRYASRVEREAIRIGNGINNRDDALG